ncbi:MAG TPA: hypothetical protein VMU34_22915, partial [Mycobacterium sp.]|nr:hypothetical protein [Mycobacterium sp.]
MTSWAGNPSFDVLSLPDEHNELRVVLRDSSTPGRWVGGCTQSMSGSRHDSPERCRSRPPRKGEPTAIG